MGFFPFNKTRKLRRGGSGRGTSARGPKPSQSVKSENSKQSRKKKSSSSLLRSAQAQVETSERSARQKEESMRKHLQEERERRRITRERKAAAEKAAAEKAAAEKAAEKAAAEKAAAETAKADKEAKENKKCKELKGRLENILRRLYGNSEGFQKKITNLSTLCDSKTISNLEYKTQFFEKQISDKELQIAAIIKEVEKIPLDKKKVINKSSHLSDYISEVSELTSGLEGQVEYWKKKKGELEAISNYKAAEDIQRRLAAEDIQRRLAEKEETRKQELKKYYEAEHQKEENANKKKYGNRTENTNAEGAVLVFDLDETIVGNNEEIFHYFKDESTRAEFYETDKQAKVNSYILNLLRVIMEHRSKVSAIIMLTNNGNKSYINYIISWIETYLNVPEGTIFDYVVSKNHRFREPKPWERSGDAPKTIEDVKKALQILKKPTANLERRILFFDDRNDHVLEKQLKNPDLQFYHINPIFQAKFKEEKKQFVITIYMGKFDVEKALDYIFNKLPDEKDQYIIKGEGSTIPTKWSVMKKE